MLRVRKYAYVPVLPAAAIRVSVLAVDALLLQLGVGKAAHALDETSHPVGSARSRVPTMKRRWRPRGGLRATRRWLRPIATPPKKHQGPRWRATAVGLQRTLAR